MLSSKKIKNEFNLVFDFRNSSLAFALIEKNSLATKILKAHRQTFFFENLKSVDSYMESFYLELKRVLSDLSKNNPELVNKISKVDIVLGSPWHNNQIKNFKITNSKKIKKLTESYVNEIIENHTETPNYLTLLENRILNFKINGYTLQEPINKKFDNLDFSVFQSLISSQTKKEIEILIKNVFAKTKINFHSHPLVIYTNIKNNFPEISNYLVLDIGGELTDIYLVQDDKIRKVFAIPIGTHYFIRNLITECKYDKHTAFSMLNMVSNGHLDNKCAGKEEKLFLKFQKEWQKQIKSAFEKNNVLSTSNIIFSISDESVKNLVKKILAEPDSYIGSLKNIKKPSITLFNRDNFNFDLVYKEPSEFDIVLSLLAEYLKIHN